MTRFLLRQCTKRMNIHTSEGRSAVGRMAGLTGIVCNLLLALGKLITGLACGSVAILADAANNFSDSASSAVTLLGFRLAQRPADKDHPFGHARYEYLAGLAVAAIILVLGEELIKASIHKIFDPQPLDSSPAVLAVLVLSIAVKFWMAGFYRAVGTEIDSGVLQAAAADSRNDCIATSAVAISCLLFRLTGWNCDGYLGLAVALFIIWSGIQSARETISPLLGRKADEALIRKLEALVLSHKKVLGIHDLLIHDYGPGQCFASLHAEVSAAENALDIHDLLDDIEDDALEQLNVHLVIHFDPVVIGDPEWDRIRIAAAEAAEEIAPALAVHDLHLMHHEKTILLGFDLEVPYDLGISQAELKETMEQKLKEKGVPYPTEIRFDGKE